MPFHPDPVFPKAILDDFAAGNTSQLPSVKQWNDEFFGSSGVSGSIVKGRGLPDAVEVHHTVEKWIQRKLGLPETDDVPGAVLRKSAGQPDGHAALQGQLRKKIFSLTNSDDIVRAILQTYQSNPNWTNLWRQRAGCAEWGLLFLIKLL